MRVRLGVVLRRFLIRTRLISKRRIRKKEGLCGHWLLFSGAFLIVLALWIVLKTENSTNEGNQNYDPNDVIVRTFSDEEALEYAAQLKTVNLIASYEAKSEPENDYWIPVNSKDNGGYQQNWEEDRPVVFVITPTYARHLQRAELTRLSQTLRLVSNLHWIVVEDSETKTKFVTRFLTECGVRYTHLNIRTNEAYRDYMKKLPRGVDQRNKGLEWLRNSIEPGSVMGVVYFADDDNVYDIELFEKIRQTKSVSIFPVGWTGLAKWSGPLCQGNRVLGFHTNYAPERTFPTDMAGFAVNLDVLQTKKPKAKFKPIRGQIETTFLEQLTTIQEIEGVPHGCSEVLVWHTRTRIPRESLKGENELLIRGEGSDPLVET